MIQLHTPPPPPPSGRTLLTLHTLREEFLRTGCDPGDGGNPVPGLQAWGWWWGGGQGILVDVPLNNPQLRLQNPRTGSGGEPFFPAVCRERGYRYPGSCSSVDPFQKPFVKLPMAKRTSSSQAQGRPASLSDLEGYPAPFQQNKSGDRSVGPKQQERRIQPSRMLTSCAAGVPLGTESPPGQPFMSQGGEHWVSGRIGSPNKMGVKQVTSLF